MNITWEVRSDFLKNAIQQYREKRLRIAMRKLAQKHGLRDGMYLGHIGSKLVSSAIGVPVAPGEQLMIRDVLMVALSVGRVWYMWSEKFSEVVEFCNTNSFTVERLQEFIDKQGRPE